MSESNFANLAKMISVTATSSESGFFTKDRIHGFLNILLVAALAASFIGLFFFTYGKNVERDIVVNNVDYLVTDLLGGVNLLPQEITSSLKEKLQKTNLGDMSKEDEKVAQHNAALLKKALTFIGILNAVVLAVVIGLAYKYDLNLMEILVEGFLILLCVGLVEIVFLYFIARKYISADPNTVKNRFVTKLMDVNTMNQNDPRIQSMNKARQVLPAALQVSQALGESDNIKNILLDQAKSYISEEQRGNLNDLHNELNNAETNANAIKKSFMLLNK